MKTIYFPLFAFLLLAFVAFPSFSGAQQRINVVVLPYSVEDGGLCDLLTKDIPQREAVEAITQGFKQNGFAAIDFIALTRIVKPKGGCEGDNQTVTQNLLAAAKAQVYVVSEPNFVKTSTGNYVSLSLTAYHAQTHEMISYQSAQSNKFYSENVKALTKRAFEKIKDQLIEDIRNGASVLAEVGNGGEIPNNRPVEVQLVSDVDVNIPRLVAQNRDAIAVVIGNRDYLTSDIPAVDFAIHDARAIKKYLIEAFGFREGNIIMEENATQAKFNAIFGSSEDHKAKLYNYVKPNKSDVFIFYSGHGAPDPETKDAYFVPVDCDPSLVKFNGYSLNTFYNNIAQIPYRSLYVVIDACFSGASDNGMLLKDISPVFIKSENAVINDEKAAVFASCAPDQVSSWYREKSHGLFTYFFLKGLQGEADEDKNRQLNVEEMRKYLLDNVTYMARRLNNREQDPQITGEPLKAILSQ